MENLDTFLSSYGYWVFFAVGFVEFVGVPIVSVPVLIVGGAMVASGTLGFWAVVLSVAAGGWLADLGWYSVGRRQGPWLIDVACGLSSNPRGTGERMALADPVPQTRLAARLWSETSLPPP